MFRSASIAAFFLMVSAGTAAADDLSALPPADSASAWQEDEGLGAAMTDAELDEHRGGFILADGIALDFSAIIDSYVDGRLVLQSQVTWTQQGAVTSHSGPIAAQATPEILAALARAGIQLSAETVGDGGFYVSADGQSAFVHRVSDGQISNLLVNFGNGGDFHQEITLSLGLPGFEASQAAMAEVLMARSLASEIQAAALAR